MLGQLWRTIMDSGRWRINWGSAAAAGHLSSPIQPCFFPFWAEYLSKASPGNTPTCNPPSQDPWNPVCDTWHVTAQEASQSSPVERTGAGTGVIRPAVHVSLITPLRLLCVIASWQARLWWPLVVLMPSQSCFSTFSPIANSLILRAFLHKFLQDSMW